MALPSLYLSAGLVMRPNEKAGAGLDERIIVFGGFVSRPFAIDDLDIRGDATLHNAMLKIFPSSQQ